VACCDFRDRCPSDTSPEPEYHPADTVCGPFDREVTPVRSDLDFTRWAIPPPAEAAAHHAHHPLSRRTFMGSMAGAAGAALGMGLLPGAALAAKPPNSDPVPTPTTTFGFHFGFLGPGLDPSSITDFNGFVGAADVQGTGLDGHGNTLLFDTDMRFMSGVYRGVDGQVHRGTFGFV